MTIERGGRVLDTYLSTPAAPDNRGERSSEKIGGHALQDSLPLITATFYITSPGLGELGLEGVGKRSGNFHSDLEVSNRDVGGMYLREGKVLYVVVQDVPFRVLHADALDRFLNGCLCRVGHVACRGRVVHSKINASVLVIRKGVTGDR